MANPHTSISAAEVSLWRACGTFTPAEAAWLLLDQAPQTSRIRDTQGIALAIANQIRERFGTDEGEYAASRASWRDDPLGNLAAALAIRPKYISLDQLAVFASERGLDPLILRPINATPGTPEIKNPPSRAKGKPGPKQSEAMAAAIEEAMALIRSGWALKRAAMEMGEKYAVKPESVLRVIQRTRQGDDN